MDRAAYDQLFDMSDRTVIVTGGTRGIGLALGEGFALSGARVVVASRKPDACAAAAAHLRSLGGEAIGVPAHLVRSMIWRRWWTAPCRNSVVSTWWSTTRPMRWRSRSVR